MAGIVVDECVVMEAVRHKKPDGRPGPVGAPARVRRRDRQRPHEGHDDPVQLLQDARCAGPDAGRPAAGLVLHGDDPWLTLCTHAARDRIERGIRAAQKSRKRRTKKSAKKCDRTTRWLTGKTAGCVS